MKKTIAEVLSSVQSGHRVFVHGQAATPIALLQGLVEEAPRLKDVTLHHLHIEGKAEYTSPQYKPNFRSKNFFVGANIRSRLDSDRIDYVPCFLSEIPSMFRSRRVPLDVAMLHLSPPDKHGYCSLGLSADIAIAATQCAPLLLAQINSHMPRVHGPGLVHISRLNAYVEVNIPLASPSVELTPEATKIGEHVASLIENGSTLQVGIGAIPEAVLKSLASHQHLGVHSEMYSDAMIDLLESGVVDNSKKNILPGQTVSSFMVGSARLHKYVDDNVGCFQLGSDFVNSPTVIGKNPKVCAINSAVEVDLTGQVGADSIGRRIISGAGGQVDFIRGAALSEGGKAIIALTSRTRKGHSRIVQNLTLGGGVVTSRNDSHFVVTEYGIAELTAKTLGERAKSMIEIAHPDDRESLEKGWFEHYIKMK